MIWSFDKACYGYAVLPILIDIAKNPWPKEKVTYGHTDKVTEFSHKIEHEFL